MPNAPYQNFVLEAKLEDLLTTHVNMNNYVTADKSLQEAPGDKKVINVYTATGDVEDLAMGEGNSQDIEASYTPVEYTVGVTQGRFTYYDEQVNKDPNIVDVGIAGVAAKMTNDFTEKAINEYKKAELQLVYSSLNFDAFVDAIALMNSETEDGLFAFINPSDKAVLRKALGTDLKYVEDFLRTGYIGHVSGVPIITSKAVTKGEVYIATKAAVKVFTKRGTEVEYARDADHRKNQYWMRKTMLVALADATKLVRMFKYPTALLSASDMVETKAATAGSTTLVIKRKAPDGYNYAYKAGTSAATVTLGTAVSGFTDITAASTDIAMSTNTHLTIALIKTDDDKPIASVDLTGATLVIAS